MLGGCRRIRAFLGSLRGGLRAPTSRRSLISCIDRKARPGLGRDRCPGAGQALAKGLCLLRMVIWPRAPPKFAAAPHSARSCPVTPGPAVPGHLRAVTPASAATGAGPCVPVPSPSVATRAPSAAAFDVNVIRRRYFSLAVLGED